MKKPVKRVLTLLIAFAFFAIWYPSLPLPDQGETLISLLWCLALTVVPPALVWVGAGRSRRLELVGWSLQAVTVVLLFIH